MTPRTGKAASSGSGKARTVDTAGRVTPHEGTDQFDIYLNQRVRRCAALFDASARVPDSGNEEEGANAVRKAGATPVEDEPAC
jgi:hypothetical protein